MKCPCYLVSSQGSVYQGVDSRCREYGGNRKYRGTQESLAHFPEGLALELSCLPAHGTGDSLTPLSLDKNCFRGWRLECVLRGHESRMSQLHLHLPAVLQSPLQFQMMPFSHHLQVSFLPIAEVPRYAQTFGFPHPYKITWGPFRAKLPFCLDSVAPLDCPEDILSTRASCLVVGGPKELSAERAGSCMGG